MMLLTLPGSPTTYYGEELAMEGIDVAYEDVQDPWGKNMGPVRVCTK
jgi:glycosidase